MLKRLVLAIGDAPALSSLFLPGIISERWNSVAAAVALASHWDRSHPGRYSWRLMAVSADFAQAAGRIARMSKRSSKNKRRSSALPALGIAGVSLALATRVSINQRSDDEYSADLTEPRNLSW